tara:strand:+ start:1655 stop:1966 length:312 start_codon:yes stop_codon:yes gene_type:complete
MRLSANGDGRMVSIGPCQNRVEVLVFPAPLVAGGVVEVYRLEADPTGFSALTSLAGTVPFNVLGGRFVMQMPPGGRVMVKLSGYAGAAGAVINAIVTSWEQGQ